MKSIIIIALLAALFISSSSAFIHNLKSVEKTLIDGKEKGIGGGWNCMICTALISQSIAYSDSHEIAVDDFIKNKLCTFFKAPLNSVCVGFVNNFGDAIINALNENKTSDEACQAAKLCIIPQCVLFTNVSSSAYKMSPNVNQILNAHPDLSFDPWAEIVKILEQFSNDQRPDTDLDNDSFSEYTATARGYNWRGRDCNDLNANIHPGRQTPVGTANTDYNCNGIYGLNQTVNQPWKTLLCANSSQMGVVVIGDSAGAHFEMSANWFNGSSWNESTFDDFVPRALDEMDLPQFSAYTSYNAEGFTGPAHSIYQYMYQRNKCNFRDYQNGGLNGCESFSEQQVMKRSWTRNQKNDHPVILFLELIGNDVCPGGNGMTTGPEFHQNIINIFSILDTQVPAGSHVIAVGLADGALLYQFLHNVTHPIGASYESVYDFLTCIGVNPCNGWLTSNATTRNLTQTRANELTSILQNYIQANGSNYQNYDLTFFPFPAQQIFNEWIAQGGNPVELAEPVDGFHPSQIFNSLMADLWWSWLTTNYTNIIGPVNPNNDLITQLFGDQGGY